MREKPNPGRLMKYATSLECSFWNNSARARASWVSNTISMAFKRIKNILRQAHETEKQIAAGPQADLLREDAEKQLWAQILEIAQSVGALGRAREYSRALIEISRIRPAVDAFFDKVMVMVEDEQMRANRLALLQTLLKEFSTIADFSEIVTAGKA